MPLDKQPGFAFDQPVHDVSTVGPTGDRLPPHHGAIPPTAHTSRSGAEIAQRSYASQAARMLVLYLERGSSTDLELSQILGLPDGRVSARRNQLITDGLVQYVDITIGPYGAKACRFELTVKGLHIAGQLQSQR